MVGVMLLPGEKVTYYGNEDIPIPYGTEGICKGIVDIDGHEDLYIIDFEDLGYWEVKGTDLSYGPFMVHDRVKVIGLIAGTLNEFFGLEAIVMQVTSNNIVIRIKRVNHFNHDLTVKASSLEKLEPIGSKWWV